MAEMCIRDRRTSTEKEMEFEPGAIQLQAEDGTMVMLDKLIKVRHVEMCIRDRY